MTIECCRCLPILLNNVYLKDSYFEWVILGVMPLPFLAHVRERTGKGINGTSFRTNWGMAILTSLGANLTFGGKKLWP